MPGIGPAGSGLGFPSELKSTARPKLGGRLTYLPPFPLLSRAETA